MFYVHFLIRISIDFINNSGYYIYKSILISGCSYGLLGVFSMSFPTIHHLSYFRISFAHCFLLFGRIIKIVSPAYFRRSIFFCKQKPIVFRCVFAKTIVFGKQIIVCVQCDFEENTRNS